MKAKSAMTLLLTAAQLLCCGWPVYGETPKMTGRWNIEIALANGVTHSLHFDARDGGKGTFSPDPKPGGWDAAKPSEAKWAQGTDNTVTFSGPMEFAVGNVGRDEGMLEFKGKFATDGSIQGEVAFSPIVGDGPAKTGTFKAVRAPAG